MIQQDREGERGGLPWALPTLINNLLPVGVYPRVWRQAKWVPVLKAGCEDASIPKHLQPISLLSCLGKTLEKIMAD